MGYPMTWQRLVGRNALCQGDYSDGGLIAGDMRRLERDCRDGAHLKGYAKAAGCTKKQAKAVLDRFFDCHPTLPTNQEKPG
jgi:hypothetical protein